MEEVAQEIFEYARRGRISDLREVISKTHPDSYVAYDGSTALLIACKNGHLEACRILIEHGADVSMRTDDGSTALLLATCTGNLDLVHLVLSKRACDVNETNEDGFTPLDMALHYSHTVIVDLLRSHGGQTSGVTTPECGEVNAGPSEKWGYGVFDQ
jgi:ankyrin repeat protein